MGNNIIKEPSDQLEGETRKLLNRDKVEESDNLITKRRQALTLLKGRYGYTEEQADVELERRLQAYYKMVKNTGNPRPRPNFKHTHAE